MPAPKPPTFTVSSLAIALGVDQAQVSRWKLAGLPFKHGRIALPAAVAWLREHERRDRARPMGRSEADERLAAAHAELAELKLATARGDVVPAAEVRAAAEDEAVRVRGVVTQLSTEFAPLLAARVGCTLREASAVLRTISDGVCARLAQQDDTEQQEAA